MNMATQTEETIQKEERFVRQRSNSDPRPNVDSPKPSFFDKKNGDLKANTPVCASTPPPDRKSRFASIGKLFKPWKWKRKKKSEKLQKKISVLERKISVRSTKEELIRKGYLKEVEEGASSNGGTTDVHHSTIVEDVKADGGNQPNAATHPVPTSDEVTGEAISNDAKSENNNGESLNSKESEIKNSEMTTITTQAEITPVATTSSSQVPATVNNHTTRPMIIPTAPTSSTQGAALATSSSDMENKGDKPESCVRFAATEEMIQHGTESTDAENDQVYRTTNQHDVVDGSRDGDTDEASDEATELPERPPIPYTGFHQIVASEPNLKLQPTKSALKNRADNDSPIASPLAKDEVKMDHIFSETLHTPQVHSVDSANIPKPSPLATPQAPSLLRNKNRPVFKETPKSGDSDKENIPASLSTPVPAPSQSFNNTSSVKPPSSYDDSSSDDEEIKYRSDDEEEELGSLAAKVARQDSLARFLSNRPSRRELVDKNIIPTQSEDQIKEQKSAMKNQLTRRLSLRPTQEELEQKNILHVQSSEDARREKEERKRYLIRKLSFRPTIDELKEKKIIKFNDYIEWTEANEYDRRADKPWTRLTPKDKAAIRKELNDFKSKEMDVHEESKHLTRFHRP